MWGIGWDYDIFPKIAVKFPTPGKSVRSNILKLPTVGNDLWSWARTKIRISLLPGQQEIQMSYPWAKQSIKSLPMARLSPPPVGLTLIGAQVNKMQSLNPK